MADTPHKIVQIVRTCDSCPTQYEGTFEDGDRLYIRYRWGRLSVEKGKDVPSFEDTPLYSEEIGDDLDGTLDDSALIEQLAGIVEFPPEFLAGVEQRDTARAEAVIRGLERFIADGDEFEAYQAGGGTAGFFSWRYAKYHGESD